MMKILNKTDIKKAASLAGTALMIASLYFIGRRLVQMQQDSAFDTALLANPLVLAPLLAIGLAEGVVIILSALNYRALLANISGVYAKRSAAIRVYAVSNLYKYIPSGVMYVLGRNQLAIETKGLSHAKVALGTLAEGIFWVAASIILSGLYAFEHSVYYARRLDMPPFWALMALGLAFGLAAALFFFRRRLYSDVCRLKKNFAALRPVMLAWRLVSALAIVSLWGFSFVLTLMIMGQPVTFGLGLTVAGLYILSWMAGYLTPGAPSGIGIREVVLLMFMGGILDEGILLSAIVVHRMLQVVGDVTAYVLALGCQWVSTRC
jgi:hypothetical protein